MLNSADHEILNAYKYKNIKKFSFFQAQISLECYFSCSHVKMPTTVGILAFMSRKISCSAELSKKFFITSGPGLAQCCHSFLKGKTPPFAEFLYSPEHTPVNEVELTLVETLRGLFLSLILFHRKFVYLLEPLYFCRS